MKKGLFYPIRIIFHSLNSKTLCFSAQETTQKCGGRTCSRKQCRSPHPLPMLFLSSLHIKLRWKMVKLNIKIEIISLLLARIHRKMENYLCISVAARRSTAPVRIFTKSPYTSLKLDYLRVFNKLFRVDGKGACFAI